MRSCAQSCSASSVSSSTLQVSPPHNRSRAATQPAALSARGCGTTSRFCSPPTGLSLQRREADALADRLLGVNGYAAEPDALVRRAADRGSFSPAFTVQLVQRLRDQDPKVTPALHWMEERLGKQGTTSDETVRDEHQRQGASNVTVRNIITS